MHGRTQPLDARNPASRLMLTRLAAVAEFERVMMPERQREGIAEAISRLAGIPAPMHGHK